MVLERSNVLSIAACLNSLDRKPPLKSAEGYQCDACQREIEAEAAR